VASSTDRVDYLDGLRAVAILAVLALHWLSWYGPFFHGGSVGVDVFFVLSGFIITTMLWRAPAQDSLRRAWVAFVRRRAVRLYPALLGLVVGAVVLWWLVPLTGLPAGEVARRGASTLAQTSSVSAAIAEGSFWLPDQHPFPQAWSLAVEWYFYLLWPVAVLAARRRGWDAARLARASLVAAAVLYAGALPLDAHGFYFGPTARFAELLVGAALALHLLAGRGAGDRAAIRSTAGPALALGAICVYALLGPVSHHPLYRYVGIPVAVLGTVVLIRAAYGHQRGRVHGLLSHRWLALVGRHSYSLYLWHLLPVLLLADVETVPKPLLGLATVATTVAVSAASYRWLERPFLRPRSDVLRPASAGSAQPQDAALGQRVEEVVGGGVGLVQADPARHLLAVGGTERAGGVEVGEEVPEGLLPALDELAGEPVEDVGREELAVKGGTVGDQEGHRPVQQQVVDPDARVVGDQPG
jgi:peptidoglycan/LPS O-acetylase OafA/YrhL